VFNLKVRLNLFTCFLISNLHLVLKFLWNLLFITSLITDGESEIFEGKGIANSLSFIAEILELKEKNEILEEELMQNKVV
jgi:hypothetical protein